MKLERPVDPRGVQACCFYQTKPEEAEEKANELIENGEISFDGEVAYGEESIIEVIGHKEQE